jgi:hypothetical protein
MATPDGVTKTKSLSLASRRFHAFKISMTSAFIGTCRTFPLFAVVAFTVITLLAKSTQLQVSWNSSPRRKPVCIEVMTAGAR